MLEHLPALQVVLPLVAAPLIVLARSTRFAWLATTAVSYACLLIAALLASRVAAGGPISYALGSWPPPWGIEYRVDALSAFVLVAVSLTASFVAPYAQRSIAAEIDADRQYLVYAMYCLCLAGLLGMAVTGDAFNLFVFLEISSLASYVLIALGRRRQALLAAFQYMLMGTVGATFYVIGVGLLYLVTGTLNLADLAERLRGVEDLRPVLAALAFITVGIGLKLALFPLHQWLPNAYAYAPSMATAFLAATATKVSVYVLLRYYFTVFDPAALFERLPTRETFLALSVAAMIVASLAAVFEQDVKRLFAWSSVAQVGYITLGIGLENHAGLTGSITHLLNHGVTKGAIFLLLGGVALRGVAPAMTVSSLAGLGRRMPLTALGLVIAGLSLIGMPGTAGFVTKWYLITGALERGAWWVVAAIVASSLIAVAYVWRVVEVAYLRPAPGGAARREAPAGMLAAGLAMAGLCVYFGLFTSVNVEGARAAASLLLKGAP
ncbi:MAG TPA: monovalent cation/H+ antiporter subunit D family protein [Burkholderiales bacterium]|jgi:multicomponent Na+:H+ antiporter subunit D|nr:monovalent cation/H+ antiporter subunit D family protein [Burkholderiales bacterium]